MYIYRHKGIQREVDSHLEWEVYIYVTIYIYAVFYLLPPPSPPPVINSSPPSLLQVGREEVRRRRRRIKGRRSRLARAG